MSMGFLYAMRFFSRILGVKEQDCPFCCNLGIFRYGSASCQIAPMARFSHIYEETRDILALRWW